MEIHELKIECASLVNLEATIWAGMSISTSWFANVQTLDFTLFDVSANLPDYYFCPLWLDSSDCFWFSRARFTKYPIEVHRTSELVYNTSRNARSCLA